LWRAVAAAAGVSGAADSKDGRVGIHRHVGRQLGGQNCPPLSTTTLNRQDTN
jgi:hypothetical protein